MKLPDYVESVLVELRTDPNVQQVWLIGSRAHGDAGEQSDWDLLVFADTEPQVVERRRNDVDVLWKGPSGKVLLEGKLQCYTIEFDEFQWSQIGPDRASYRGKKFMDNAGDMGDTWKPPQRFVPGTALRLWTRKTS